MTAATLTLAAATLLLAACASKPDEPPHEGMFSGYDFGNRQDMEQIRENRTSEIDG